MGNDASSIRRLVRAGLRPVRIALVTLGRRLLSHTRVDGFELIVYSGESEKQEFFAKVTHALRLISAYDPARYGRIQRDLGRLALVQAGGDYLDTDVNTFVMSLEAILRRSNAEVASSIVHEATHARLHRRGIRYGTANKERIERICVGEEIAFVNRLPDGAALALATFKKLERPWWGDDEWHRREDAQLRAHGVPEWLIRIRARLMRVSDTQ